MLPYERSNNNSDCHDAGRPSPRKNSQPKTTTTTTAPKKRQGRRRPLARRQKNKQQRHCSRSLQQPQQHSLEYKRALQSLEAMVMMQPQQGGQQHAHAPNKNNRDASMVAIQTAFSKLTTRDQVHFIQELACANRHNVIADLMMMILTTQGTRKQHDDDDNDKDAAKVAETAVVALASSPRHKSLVLQQVCDKYCRNFSAKTFVLLFQRTVSNASEAAALMDKVQEQQSANAARQDNTSDEADSISISTAPASFAVNSIQVWNAALYACYQRHKDDDDKHNSWQIALTIFRDLKRHCRRLRHHYRHDDDDDDDRHQHVPLAPNTETYAYVLHACAQAGQVQIVLSLLQEMMQQQQQQQSSSSSLSNISSSPHVWGSALLACAKAPRDGFENALLVLQYMQQHNVPINAIHISAFLSTCSGQVALDLLGAFQRKHSFSFPALTANSKNGSAATTNPRRLTIPPVPIDLVLINTVLLANKKNYTAARHILDEIKRGAYSPVDEPDVISYNTVLSACDDPIEAQALVKEMRMSRRHRHGAVPPTSMTYTHAISACRTSADVATARLFLDMAQKDDGIEPNVYMYSAAIWCCRDDADTAMELLHEMRLVGCVPNVVSYNGVMSALATVGRAEEALSLFEEIKDSQVLPNRITFQKLASAIRASTEDIAKSEMLEHVLALMNSFEMRANVGGPIVEALIRQYGAGGKFEDARRVFEKISGTVDAKCLRAILYACFAGEPPRWEEALNLLHSSDIVDGARGPAKVDSNALSYAMLACTKADQWEEALKIAELYGRSRQSNRIVLHGDQSLSATTLPAFNALLAACGRCGQTSVAIRLINDMETVFGITPDQESYRTVVIACNQAEHDKRRRQRRGLENRDDGAFWQWWECALSLLRRMEESKIQVDPQTYSSVISACEAAGQWQRALGVLQTMIRTEGKEPGEHSKPNLYCFNAAISACEKGGAWVEALDLFCRMKDIGGSVTPNFVTLSSLLVALDNAGQKELAQSTYEEGVRDGIVIPWKLTHANDGGLIRAMDLHRFSAAMANAAVRSVIESLLSPKPDHDMSEQLVIIVGKGKGSEGRPILLSTVRTLLKQDYSILGKVDPTNAGRYLISPKALQSFVKTRQ